MTEPEITFASLGLRESLVTALGNLGYEAPTPIQERTIPLLLAGRDIIGQAQTGTGKTAAFALPILEKLDPAVAETQALVMAPTRELAVQVAEAIHSYAHGMNISILPVYGGASMVHQLKRLQHGVQIVVGTPGRLIDHLDRGTLKLGAIRIIVLDEADEMLRMGFIDDVERVLSTAPAGRQIALFSATMPPEIVRIAQKHLADAAHVEIEHKTMTAPDIAQRFLNVAESQKLDTLTKILELEEHEATLIFRRTKTGAADLTERLQGRGFAAEAMHGDMNQRERESVIRRLKAGQIEIVVATDVAARGLDVEQISHVINFDIPYDVEAYVHRIGRTGRAGRSGMATLFVTPRERRMMREIERYSGTSIKPMKMPTAADVAARRIDAFKDTIRKTVQEGDLDLYLEVVEQLVGEGQHDISEIAAAAAMLASTARPIAMEPESGRVAAPVAAAPPLRARAESRSRTPLPEEDAVTLRKRPQLPFGERPRPGRPAPADSAGGVRLVMAVGKDDGIRPADVVGSIANEADIPGRDIGPIDIRDDVTYVTVPAGYVDKVLEKVGRAKFRGRPVNLRVAEEGEGGPPRRSGYKRDEGPRPQRFGGTRDDRPPRRTADRESKPFRRDAKPFDRDAKPFHREAKPFDRERKPFDREAKPFARGDRKPFSKPGGSKFGASKFGGAKPAGRPAGRSFEKRDDRDSGSRSERPKGGAFSRFAGPGKSGPKGRKK